MRNPPSLLGANTSRSLDLVGSVTTVEAVTIPRHATLAAVRGTLTRSVFILAAIKRAAATIGIPYVQGFTSHQPSSRQACSQGQPIEVNALLG